VKKKKSIIQRPMISCFSENEKNIKKKTAVQEPFINHIILRSISTSKKKKESPPDQNRPFPSWPITTQAPRIHWQKRKRMSREGGSPISLPFLMEKHTSFLSQLTVAPKRPRTVQYKL
jgi:hypothetical protein